MKVIVTGGSGYLGMHVRRFFSADDFSRRSHLDILNPHDAALLADYDVVIHLAAHLDKDPAAAQSSFRTNAEGTVNVLRNMRAGAVLIFASTKDVYGMHANAYVEVPETCSTDYCGQSALEWSKLIAEHYINYYAHHLDLRSCIFRLSTVYARQSEDNESGFVTHYVESVKRGWTLRLPLGGAPVRDILHVDDFSRACRAFIDSPHAHGLYNLGGGRANSLSLREIVERVGRMIELEPVIDRDAQVQPPVPVNYISDLTRVREELGWEPTVGVEEGLRSLL
ncbi:MAG TPA: NAD-dependent epimerase/dehydratase family protein [Pyrinomonadaceae bacterium]|jgi:nucleoside-diphosphate-sugar epimerase|nr:NAD-dependent epimerase/dehydratase family protein [Pyrinomonadaceae bacterium]